METIIYAALVGMPIGWLIAYIILKLLGEI